MKLSLHPATSRVGSAGKRRTEGFFGREKENLVFPIALANLVLHGIDQPNLWHGNTLTKRATYNALFDKAPKFFDVILTNPPFGGKEGKDAQKNYAYATGTRKRSKLSRRRIRRTEKSNRWRRRSGNARRSPATHSQRPMRSTRRYSTSKP